MIGIKERYATQQHKPHDNLSFKFLNDYVGINKILPDEGLMASSDVEYSDVVTSIKPRTYAEAVRTNVTK